MRTGNGARRVPMSVCSRVCSRSPRPPARCRFSEHTSSAHDQLVPPPPIPPPPPPPSRVDRPRRTLSPDSCSVSDQYYVGRKTFSHAPVNSRFHRSYLFSPWSPSLARFLLPIPVVRPSVIDSARCLLSRFFDLFFSPPSPSESSAPSSSLPC